MLEVRDDRIQRLGTIPVTGAASQNVSVEVQLPQRPRRVVINARNDVLTR
jgi:hypothetical protein